MQSDEECDILSNSIINLNLEETIQKNEDKEFISQIFSDEQKILKSTVKEIINDIDLRKIINKEILLRIDCDKGNCGIKLNILRNPYLIEKDTGFINQLESKIIELNSEKRKEEVECWRDIMFLKKYLMKALQDYWTSFRRTILFENE